MFSNRLYAGKLGGAIALVLGLGLWSADQGERRRPELWRCLAQPRRWAGTELYLHGVQVVSVDEDSFAVDPGGRRVTVRPTAAVRPGDRVDLAGTWDAEGPHLRLRALRAAPPAARLRWLVFSISALTVALVALNLHRHFAFRPKGVQVEASD